MAQVIVTESSLENIAGAIRAKLGTQATYKPAQMAGAIAQIHGDPVLEALNVNANGTYTPSSGKDGFSQAVVNVPNSYSSGDEGKVVSGGALVAQSSQSITQNGTYDTTLKNQAIVSVPNSYSASDEGKVVDNGALVAQSSQTITDNGTYDTTLKNQVTVNVSGGGSVLVPKTITQNGTYNPASDNADGYSQVVVNVSGGGGDDWTNLKDYIESSGTQYINTGYIPTSTTKFEMVANVPDNSTSYPALFGERTASSNGIVIFAEFNGGSIAMEWANGDNALSPVDWNRGWIGKKCEYVMGDGIRGVRDTDGFGFCGIKAIGNAATLPIYIFVLNQNNSPLSVTWCTMKLYRFRIYEGETKVHEYVPWTDTNDVVCLKDNVTGNLFYNAGTGNFVRGEDE